MENLEQSPNESADESMRKRKISRRRYEEKRRRKTKQLLIRFSDKNTVMAASCLIRAVIEHSKILGKPLSEVFEKYALLVNNKKIKDSHDLSGKHDE